MNLSLRANKQHILFLCVFVQLLEAIVTGNLPEVQKLITVGVDLSSSLALLRAAEAGQVDIVQYLIERCNVDRNQADEVYYYPSMYC